jgi:methylaspartate ammonia-lyase
MIGGYYMKILDVVCSKGMTGFFFDDQKAIKGIAVADGSTYKGMPVTQGFKAVRQAGEALSVMLILEDGQLATGDCAAVQYSGTGGRDQLFLAEAFIPVVEELITPVMKGREITTFREMSAEIERLKSPIDNNAIHTALRYGITQAILDAVAKSRGLLMTEILAEEYGTSVSKTRIPIFSQSGDNRYENVDKMILKQADILPHGLINNVAAKLGEKGELLLGYVKWLNRRVGELSPASDYKPIFHLDVYGTIGILFKNDMDNIADYLKQLEQAAYPYQLRIEGPVDLEDRELQMLALQKLTSIVDRKNIKVQIVADEWCNTLEDIIYFADNRAGHIIQIKTPDLGGIQNIMEAVLYCKKSGIGAYQGGTCNETDRSSQVCVHVAMAAKPDQILAKPGMGVDEGYMIVFNEMQRILALLRRKGELL